MSTHSTILSIVFICFSLQVHAESIELMSYNVENLFDTSHDEGHADFEYLPFGHPAKDKGCSEIENDYFRGKCFKTNWSNNILSQKLASITDVVLREGRQAPEILGLVEIENLEVANMLASKLGYNKVLITNGLDQRGINVALLVRESSGLKYVDHREIEVTTTEMRKPTRNVLHVKFKTKGAKFLNVFVNHWPSQNNPSRDREVVARKLLHYIDELKSDGKKHFIAILGDFNVVKSDNPNAITEVLLRDGNGLVDVEQKFRQIENYRFSDMPPSSYYYRRGNNWNHLDRIIVSKNLLDGRGEEVELESFDIYAHPNYSKNHQGQRVPVRFEIKGNKTRGVSDHFPISVKLKL